MAHLLLIGTVLLISLATFGDALQCFDCAGLSDPKCQDPFNSNNVKINICPAGQDKSCLKSKGKAGGIDLAARHCSPLPADGCYEATINGVTTTMCSCSSDLCNGSSKRLSLGGAGGTVILLSTVALILRCHL
ncbi:hypothetical protein BV898_13895 [Hypsibius exemplaris]|uniref:Protein sleepless n=1 Tax=Hypsibius exemplaris TaxID=2072580 RepID=A0A1W0W9L5_HYPEX|nr:hypothetical protein BV898_13895 [Hypsibius exemplaris]